ncbi:MFS transporter [Sporosarcina sp. 179-K 3D1 HS]|uniref:MFS transporter n=1 Tax=Sporosarcina sp. 179-K 3D1 HS TaxID=3232169 RepID=UPI00399FDDDA
MKHQQLEPKNIILLFAIFAISLNMRPAITSIGPMLETIRDELSLTNTQVSLLTALPVIGMGVFASLAPILNRRLGLRKTMYLMILLVGMMTALRGFLEGYFILLGTALVIGIAIAVIGPLLSAMIKQNFPERAASVIGLYSFGMGMGATISAGLTAVFFEATDSYRFALSIWGLLALIGWTAWFFVGKGKWTVRQQEARERKGRGRSPWKVRQAWLFLLFFGLQSSAFFSIMTWMVPLAMASGMSLLQAGTLLSVMTTFQIVLNIALPLLMQRYPARRNWIWFLAGSGMAATALLWTGLQPAMWFGAFLMGFPLGGLFPIALLLPLDETETGEETNSWTAMMQTGGFIIGGLLPLLIAMVYDWTVNHHFTYAIILSLYTTMAVIAFLIGDRD